MSVWRSIDRLDATGRRRRHHPRIAHRLVIDDLGEAPDRWLVIGPDRAGNLLEIVVLISSDGDEFVIHAMPMRPKYRKLLEP